MLRTISGVLLLAIPLGFTFWIVAVSAGFMAAALGVISAAIAGWYVHLIIRVFMR